MKLCHLIIWIIVLFFLSTVWADTTGDQKVRIESIQADFIQEKHLQILARPILSTGTFAFKAPRSLRWEYNEPVPSLLIMHKGKTKKYFQKDGHFAEDKGMRFDTMQVVLSEISGWLEGKFEENDMFSVTVNDGRTILLTPKQKSLSKIISSIELQLGQQNGLLDSVTIYEGPNSYTKMIFKNKELNWIIPLNRFTVP